MVLSVTGGEGVPERKGARQIDGEKDKEIEIPTPTSKFELHHTAVITTCSREREMREKHTSHNLSTGRYQAKQTKKGRKISHHFSHPKPSSGTRKTRTTIEEIVT